MANVEKYVTNMYHSNTIVAKVAPKAERTLIQIVLMLMQTEVKMINRTECF